MFYTSLLAWRRLPVQFRLPAAIVVFLGSYFPISVILMAQDFDYSALKRSFCWPLGTVCKLPLQNPWFSASIFFLCLLCFALTLLALRLAPAKLPIVIREATYVPADLMNYTLPYIVSVMSIGYQETGKFVGLVIFLGWMFWITHRAGQLILNPVLVAFGWKLYDLTYNFPGYENQYSGRALANGPIVPGQRYRHTAIQDVLIIRTKAKQED